MYSAVSHKIFSTTWFSNNNNKSHSWWLFVSRDNGVLRNFSLCVRLSTQHRKYQSDGSQLGKGEWLQNILERVTTVMKQHFAYISCLPNLSQCTRWQALLPPPADHKYPQSPVAISVLLIQTCLVSSCAHSSKLCIVYNDPLSLL